MPASSWQATSTQPPRRCPSRRSAGEDTGNPELIGRILVPIEHTIPESARYTLYHQGRAQMLDHMLITRNLLAGYRGSEIHNEATPPS